MKRDHETGTFRTCVCTSLMQRLVVLTTFVGLCASSRSAMAQAAIDEIWKDWQQARSIQSVKYELVGTGRVLRGSFNGLEELPFNMRNKVLPAEDYVFPAKNVLYLDFARERVRNDFQREDFFLDHGKFYLHRAIWLFDGNQLQRFRPTDDNGVMQTEDMKYDTNLYLEEKESTRYQSILSNSRALFLAHCILPDAKGKWATPERLKPTIDEKRFRLLGVGSRDGREYSVVRLTIENSSIESYSEIWVDSEDASRIVRYSQWTGGAEHSRYDLWYSGGQLDRYTYSKLMRDLGPVVLEEMRVVSCVLNPEFEDRDFYVEPTAGIIVHDKVAKRRYRFGGGLMPDIDVDTLVTQELLGRSRWSMPRVAALMITCAVILALSYALLRRKLARSA